MTKIPHYSNTGVAVTLYNSTLPPPPSSRVNTNKGRMVPLESNSHLRTIEPPSRVARIVARRGLILEANSHCVRVS